MNYINFDRPKLTRLKTASEQAKKNGEDCFTFDGEKILVSYAKYLIEYLESEFTKRGA